jgi:hypothetical protein
LNSEPSLTDWISAVTAAVVAVFAVLQVLLAWWDSRERRRAAHNVVWGEWNRLMMVEQRWRDEDLVALADHGVLDPAEIVPSDWALLSTNLAQVGGDTARYGASAYTFLTGAAQNVRILINLVAQAPRQVRKPEHIAVMRGLEKKVKGAVRQGVLLLEDAMAVGPAWMRRLTVNLGEQPQSVLGQRLKEEIARREQKRHWWR